MATGFQPVDRTALRRLTLLGPPGEPGSGPPAPAPDPVGAGTPAAGSAELASAEVGSAELASDAAGPAGPGAGAVGSGSAGLGSAAAGPEVCEQTAELAGRLRALAAADPERARAVVAQLVAALNRTTGGAFAAHLSPAARAALGLVDDRKVPIDPGPGS